MNHHSLSLKIPYLCDAIFLETLQFVSTYFFCLGPTSNIFIFFLVSFLFFVQLVINFKTVNHFFWKQRPPCTPPTLIVTPDMENFFGQFLGVVTVIQGSDATLEGSGVGGGWRACVGGRVSARWNRLLLRNCCQWKQNKLDDRHVCLSVGTVATQKRCRVCLSL